METVKRLTLTVTGEALRGLCAMRINDHKLLIERQEKSLATLKADLELAQKDPVPAVPRRRPRMPRPLMSSGYIEAVDDADQEQQYLRGQIAVCEMALYASNAAMKRVLWLHDQIKPNGEYTLGVDDLVVLGFSVNRGELPINDTFMV